MRNCARRSLSQAALGEILHVEQPAVAKLEKRADMGGYVCEHAPTLHKAMGGELEIVARFPDRAVFIRSFRDLGKRELV